jgi:hypothetical protein
MTAKIKARHKLTIADRRAKIADCLINQKMTIRQAAQAAGCAIGTAHADYIALRAEWAESAADLVDLEQRRVLADLERLASTCWNALTNDITDISAMTGGQAASTLLRTLEMKAQILGLFPAKAPAFEVRQGMIVLPPEDPLSGGCGLLKIHADRQP